MTELLTDPAVWAAFLSLTVLEIILGIDNIVFVSIAAAQLPPHQRRTARLAGLSGALVMRIGLLFAIAWVAGLTRPIVTLFGVDFSWRDALLIAGGAFLIAKATLEIHGEIEGGRHERHAVSGALGAVVVQIVLLDAVFSIDSVLTAVGMVDHVEVMIAAVVVAILMMMVASEPIAAFIERHPTTKMLALAFLAMVGVALVADGFHQHIERGFIYAAMGFSALVEALNLARRRRQQG